MCVCVWVGGWVGESECVWYHITYVSTFTAEGECVRERECVCVSVHKVHIYKHFYTISRLLVSWVWVVWVSVCSLCG